MCVCVCVHLFDSPFMSVVIQALSLISSASYVHIRAHTETNTHVEECTPPAHIYIYIYIYMVLSQRIYSDKFKDEHIGTYIYTQINTPSLTVLCVC